MPTKKTSPKQFTITEAAKKLKVTRAGVHDAIKRGRLKAKWGVTVQIVRKKALLISAASLERYRADHSQPRKPFAGERF